MLMNNLFEDFSMINNNINVSQLIEDVYNNMIKLKQMNVREYLIYKKYQELMEDKNHINKYNEIYYKYIPTTLEEAVEVYHNIVNHKSISVELISSKKDLEIFTILLKGTTLMEIVSNPGRNLKFWIKETISNKIIGFLIIGSDIISIKDRDDYIGWDKECKLKKRRLQNTAIARTIVATQPFGYLFNGGKLITLLLNDEVVRKSWKNRYNMDLVLVTTTSLFGRPSMYDGVPKYIKDVGETKGTLIISPDNEYMKLIHKYLRMTYPEEYNNAIKQTGPKQQVLKLFFQKHKHDILKLNPQFNYKTFQHGFIRGVYLIPFYQVEHVRDFLTCKIDKPDEKYLMFKSKTEEIIDYWSNKFGKKRFEKIVQNNISLPDHYVGSNYDRLLKSNFNFEEFLKLNQK